MIRMVDQELLPLFMQLCETQPLGCRMAGTAAAYGLGRSFAEYWIQFVQGEATAALARLDSAVTVWCRADGDCEELCSFLSMLPGISSVLYAGEKTSLGLHWPICQGDILSYAGKESGGSAIAARALQPDEAGQCFSLLRDLGEPGIYVNGRDGAAYTDFSYRLRHGLIRALGVYEKQGENRRLNACVMTTAESGGMAVIGGVATRPECRGKGLASGLVILLAEELNAEAKRVCLLAQRQMTLFYRRLGFEPWGLWNEFKKPK